MPRGVDTDALQAAKDAYDEAINQAQSELDEAVAEAEVAFEAAAEDARSELEEAIAEAWG